MTTQPIIRGTRIEHFVLERYIPKTQHLQNIKRGLNYCWNKLTQRQINRGWNIINFKRGLKKNYQPGSIYF